MESRDSVRLQPHHHHLEIDLDLPLRLTLMTAQMEEQLELRKSGALRLATIRKRSCGRSVREQDKRLRINERVGPSVEGLMVSIETAL